MGSESEYDQLKQEVLQYQRLRVQILSFTIVAVGTLIALPLNLRGGDSPSVLADAAILVSAFAPFLVLVPSCYLVAVLYHHIIYINTYLAVFHDELRPGFCWHRLEFIIGKPDKRVRKSTRLNFAFFYSVLGVAAAACTVMVSFIHIDEQFRLRLSQTVGVNLNPGCFRTIIIGSVVLLLAWLAYYAWFKLYHELNAGGKRRFIEYWSELRSQIEPPPSEKPGGSLDS